MKKYKKPLWIATLVVSVSALMGSVFIHSALAATAQIYLSPNNVSIVNQATTSVAVRINPGTTVTNVQAVVTYDASKLDFVAIDASNSAFEAALGSQTGGAGTVTIRRGSFSGGVSADSLVATITFRAVAGSGTTTIGLSPAPNTDSFDTNGDSIGATLSGATATLTTPPANTVPTPAPVCATGQTGTYPNCVTPVKTSTGIATPSPSAGSTTKPTPVPTTTTTPTIAGAPKVTNTPATQYSQATVTVTTDVPTRAYLKYGLTEDHLSITTPVTDLATNHVLSPDPTTLVPGQIYYYSVVATNAAGTVTESTVAQFKLKGLVLKVSVLDQNHKPLKNSLVTLHSTPQTVKTDDKGYAALQDVTPGTHHVVYTVGKKTYSQEIQVVNNIITNGATQTAPTQNFSVVYPFIQSTFAWQRIAAVIAALGIVLVGVFIFIRRQRQLIGQPVLVSESKVVTANEAHIAPEPDSSTTVDTTVNRSEQLQQLSGVPLMHPGTTISPRIDSEEKARF